MKFEDLKVGDEYTVISKEKIFAVYEDQSAGIYSEDDINSNLKLLFNPGEKFKVINKNEVYVHLKMDRTLWVINYNENIYKNFELESLIEKDLPLYLDELDFGETFTLTYEDSFCIYQPNKPSLGLFNDLKDEADIQIIGHYNEQIMINEIGEDYIELINLDMDNEIRIPKSLAHFDLKPFIRKD